MHSSKSRKKSRQGEADFPLRRYKITLDGLHPTLLSHWHEEAELARVSEGHGSYQVNMDSFAVGPGDLILIPPKALHSISAAPQGALRADVFRFHMSFLGARAEDICARRYLAPLASGRLVPPYLLSGTAELRKTAEECFFAVNQASLSRQAGYELQIKSALLRLMAGLIPHCQAVSQAPTVQSENLVKIKKALEYIEYHYTKPITIQELAELCEFTDDHFMRFFKKYTGLSCGDYIKILRLDQAAQLLVAGHTPSDALQAAGFRNLSYFYREFKKLYRMTPGEFQAQSPSFELRGWECTGRP